MKPRKVSIRSFCILLLFFFVSTEASIERPNSFVSRVETTSVLPRGGNNSNNDEDSKSTIAASVFNLVNNVAGAGILTLSGGMASGTGWIPAMLICAVLGMMSGHCFAIIGEACELTGESDFKVGNRKDCCRSVSSLRRLMKHSLFPKYNRASGVGLLGSILRGWSTQ